MTAYNAIRMSPQRHAIAWHRPDKAGDDRPWLMTYEDSDMWSQIGRAHV